MSILEGDGGANDIAGDIDDDSLFGFDGDDTLSGGDGNDTLNGGAGNDVLRGGAGFDIASYAGASSGVNVTLYVSGPFNTVGAGIDELVSIAGIEGSDHADVLTGDGSSNFLAGGSGDDLLTGHEGLDTLRGGSGNDTITGGDDDDTLEGGDGADALGGGYGRDLIIGGAGGDILGGGDEGDRFVLGFGADAADASPAEHDRIEDFEGAGAAGGDVIDLSAGVATGRRLIFNATPTEFVFFGLGLASGQQLPDDLAGDGFADLVWAIDYATDHLRLWVDADDDGLFSVLDQRVEILVSGGGWTLTADEFAGLTPALEGSHGNDALSGEAADDIILGRNGDDTLAGGNGRDELLGSFGNDQLSGGAGSDTLSGGAGDDVYTDAAGDIILEAAAGGRDTLVSAATASLGALAEVENLILSGSAHANASGNARANVLNGNTGNNILNGGAGADTMAGGAGNDIYYVDHSGDQTVEAAGQGNDLISSSVSRSLAVNVENLNLSGTANIDGNGNTGANRINGNDGNNVMRGYEGADTLNGGGGSDILLGGTSSDAINPGSDAVRDIIRFGAVGESTGSQRDIVSGLDLNGEDRLDFTVVPTMLVSVGSGMLNLSSINADLAAAVDTALAPGGAVVFDPSAGDLNVAGHIFVVVDRNGDGVYKPSQDYVVQLIDVAGALSLDDFI